MIKKLLSALLVCAMVFMLFGCETSQAKLSTMESDCTTLDMLIKEAINTYHANIRTKTYNGRTADSATVGDLLTENLISSDSDFFTRTIGGTTYTFVFVEDSSKSYSSGSVKISGGDYNNTGKTITSYTTITSLIGESGGSWGTTGGTTTTGSFTNKYGTSTTKCAHPGCSNYIASSGDTNCCTLHSNRCGTCGKYIDEDAMYCLDCIADALY